ncbi:MFS transporter [Sphaerochaeta sp.]|uniref:MFS transporter n=1 Tax=Sphaerochaeta sp. TaxID=1972642 RepID=UPI003D0C793F
MTESRLNLKFTSLFAINFLITFCFGINDSLFSLYYSTYSVNGLLFGLSFTLYSVSKIAFSPFTGALLDRYKPHRVLLVTLIMYFSVSASFYLIHNEIAIIAVRIVQGISCAMFRPIMYYILGRNEEGGSGKILGTFDISFYSALALAPLVGGLVVKWGGFRTIFIVMMFCCMAAMAVALAFSGFYKIHKGCETHEDSSEFSTGTVNRLMVYIFCRGMGISVITAFLPIYLSGINIDISAIGVLLCVITACTALFLPLTSSLADKVSKEMLIASGGIAVSLILMTLTSFTGFIPLLVVVGLSGFFSALSQPACSSLMIEKTEKKKLGSTIGKFNSSMGLGFAFGPFAGMLINKTLGINAVFIIAGLLGIVTSGMFLFSAEPKTVSISEEIGNSPLN